MSKGNVWRVLTAVLVIVWLFAVTVSYYLIHKPFGIGNLLALPSAVGDNLFHTSYGVANILALANVVGDALVMLALVVLAAALGHWLLKQWNLETPLETVVMSAGVGLGALALILFFLALLGVVNVWVYWSLLVIGLLLLRNDLLELWRIARAIQLLRPTRLDTALALFCVLALSLTVLFALTPPWGWDGLQYHLIFPKLIIQNGRMVPPPDNASLDFPNLVEMLFLAGMVLKGDGATQGLHWIFLPLTLGAMLIFAGKYFSWRIGWLAAAFFCAVPTVALLATYAYNDLALTFYTFTAFLFTLRARETGQARDFVLAGALCGFAFGEKYTAVFIPIALALLVIRLNRAALSHTFLLLASAGILMLPWLVRNFFFVGNPIYPFVFGGTNWDAARTAWYSRFGTGLLQRPLELFIVPWTMTVQGTQSDLFQINVGPLLLALLPLNLIPARPNESNQNTPRHAMWFFAWVLYVVWLLGVAESNLLWQGRLLLPAFPLFALLAANGVERLATLNLPQFSLQRFATLVVVLVLALTAVSYTIAFFSDSALGYFVGAVTRDEYLTQHLGSNYTIAQWVNANLPSRARLLFLWEPRVYYFQRESQADALLDRFVHLHLLNGDASAIADELKREGYTHVVLYREGLDNLLQTGYDPITNDDVETLDAFVRQDLTPVYGSDSLALETRNGRYGLERASQEPYAIYQLQAP